MHAVEFKYCKYTTQFTISILSIKKALSIHQSHLTWALILSKSSIAWEKTKGMNFGNMQIPLHNNAQEFNHVKDHYVPFRRCIHSLLQHTTHLRYRCIDYLSTAAQRNVLHLKLKLILTLLQYRTAIVGAEMAIQALQLTTTQLQWTMTTA